MLKSGVWYLHTARKVAPAGMLRQDAGGMTLLEKQEGANDPKASHPSHLGHVSTHFHE